jgi:hypothetical protein
MGQTESSGRQIRRAARLFLPMERHVQSSYRNLLGDLQVRLAPKENRCPRPPAGGAELACAALVCPAVKETSLNKVSEESPQGSPD